MTQVLVTGGTGFIGNHVVRKLCEKKFSVRALARLSSSLDCLQSLPVEIATGDLRDKDSLTRAVAGCEVVFHVAADYRLWARDPGELYRSNVEGTRSLLEAARKQGARRVVYTSSVATMGFTASNLASSNNGNVADEQSPVGIADMIGHYKRSKFMAEQVAVEAARSG